MTSKSWLSYQFRLGSITGVDIYAHWTLAIAVGLVAFSIGHVVYGLAAAVVLFTSILLHELGHVLVARWVGVGCRRIYLHGLGGLAQLTGCDRMGPRDEIRVALAGPFVSLLLASVLSLTVYLPLPAAGDAAMTYMVGINLIIGIFNLTPAFPLDGGRVLRGALVLRQMRGEELNLRMVIAGTRTAVKVSRSFAGGFVAFGIWAGAPQLVVLAAAIWILSGNELKYLLEDQA